VLEAQSARLVRQSSHSDGLPEACDVVLYPIVNYHIAFLVDWVSEQEPEGRLQHTLEVLCFESHARPFYLMPCRSDTCDRLKEAYMTANWLSAVFHRCTGRRRS
jgi:hypothetical protein